MAVLATLEELASSSDEELETGSVRTKSGRAPNKSRDFVGAYNKLVKDYKMIRLAKADRGEELGIIIAKKKLKEIQTTGFHIVHIEPQGLVDK